jgi:uncharacterized protein YbjT (DUF2867 family)
MPAGPSSRAYLFSMAARPSSRTVCILGGSGFVGRRLASRLIRQGWSVLVPTRNRQRSRRLLVLPGVRLVEADVHREAVLSRLLHGCDAAINLVGILNEKGHNGSGFRAAHVELTEKLVRACQLNGVGRLLHMSALKANAERGPSHFLRTKGEAERVLQSLAGEDLKYAIFQPSVIFGPEDHFINRFAKLLRRSPVLALPRLSARFAPVFVDNVAEAFAVALEDNATDKQTYQLCGPDICTFREILLSIQRLLGLRRVLFELPDPIGQLQGLIAEYLVPGRPFSVDNFRSLTIASVCTENGLGALGIRATSMEAVVPGYLLENHQRFLARLRQNAGR